MKKPKVSNESQFSTKDLITIDLRPWSRTNKPWKGHLRPASIQTPLTWKPIIIYFGIWHRFRECLGKFNGWSCSTVAWATGTLRWFHRLAPCFRWRLPLRNLLPVSFPRVSPVIIIVIITAAPILPLSRSPVTIYLLLLPFRFSARSLIETILSFFDISSLDWMIMVFLGPRSILFNPSQTIIYWQALNQTWVTTGAI